MIAADVGMRIDDQCLADHPLNALNRARFAREHGSIQFRLAGRVSKPNGTLISKIAMIGWERRGEDDLG